MFIPSATCFWFPAQVIVRARSRAPFSAGSSIAARIAIMAITTSSSINVNLFNIISWLLLHHFVFLTFSGRESVVSVYYTKLPAQKQERQPFRRYDSSGK